MIVVQDLVKTFKVRKKAFGKQYVIKPINNVSFEIKDSETLGVVGESGCGKTTLGKTIIRLLDPDSGKIIFDGVDISKFKETEIRKLRKDIQIVFQDPFSSLNPRMTVYDILARPLRIHKKMPKTAERELIVSTLESVGLKSEHIGRFPHEFSGGQRQRIAIARAIITRPKFIVLDEPTSALDVSVQAQIMNLLKELKEKMKLTFMFISHDLSVIRFLSDRIAVMYLGQIVELAQTEDVLKNPLHPYTQLLFSSIPSPNPERKMELKLDTSEVPSFINLPQGCLFSNRCQYKFERCEIERPSLLERKDGHKVACHLYFDTEGKPKD